MKLAIVADVDRLVSFEQGENINYMKFIVDSAVNKMEVIVFDWRDVSPDLNLSRHLTVDSSGYHLIDSMINLNDGIDKIFVKQLGKISESRGQFLSFLTSLENCVKNK